MSRWVITVLALTLLSDSGGTYYKGDWHKVEVYLAMNSIQGLVGVANGKIRWVQDGQTLISSDNILFRTGEHANLKFDKIIISPYIGDGSPVTQQFWIDDLQVATARTGGCGNC